ncbi:MAG TPA: hypothetical protein VKY19_27755 [Ktedonosporobacter sp.]|nr:hypothetical protein [Ktedonosporobacter sp.]
MSLSTNELPRSSIVALLYIQALRQGLALWFTVASGSMRPLLAIGNEIYIEPAQAHELRIGEIAAFETPQGIVVHRIVRRRKSQTTIRLLQMADIDLYPSWIEAHDVIGRVTAVRRDSAYIDLQHPLARQMGAITAYIRYWLFRYKRYEQLGSVLHTCARAVVHLQNRWIRRCCASSLIGNELLIKHETFEQEKQYVATE